MINGKHKLAIFDIDGTIAKAGQIPPEVVAGIKHLQDIGYTTTVSSGRGYVRVLELFGDLFEKLISPDALIITEHGTKIVNRDGKIEFAEYLAEDDIGHVMDFIRANIEIIKLVWFNSNATDKLKVWVYDEKDVSAEREKRGGYADVEHGSLGQLSKDLLAQRLSNISARLHDHVKVQNLKLALSHTPLSLVFLDGNMEFIRNNANKGLAVEYLLKRHGLSVKDLMVAGNAINDVEMLDIDAAYRVVVGEPVNREPVIARLSDTETLTLVESPQAFGRWMQTHIAK